MIPSALFIAARSAARAAADIGAFTSGLILLRRSWMATASAADQRLAASLAHRSCVAAHLIVVRLALRLGTVDGHRSLRHRATLEPPWACVKSHRYVTWNRFRGDNITLYMFHLVSPGRVATTRLPTHPPRAGGIRRRGWRVHPTTVCHLGLPCRGPRPPCPTRHTAPHRHRPHPLLLQLISITVRLYSRSRNNCVILYPHFCGCELL